MIKSLFVAATLALVADTAEGVQNTIKCGDGTFPVAMGRFPRCITKQEYTDLQKENKLPEGEPEEDPEVLPEVILTPDVPELAVTTDEEEAPEEEEVTAQFFGLPSSYGGGDPHFQTWNGDFFSYHGACDLVLVNSPGFGNGKGLRLHIRTERRNMFSFISNAALQVGNDVMEVQSDGQYFVNGVANPTGLIWMGGEFGVTKTDMDNCGKNLEKASCSKFVLALPGNFGNIEMSTKYGVVFVSFKGHFPDSVGLLGSYDRPGMIARNPEINLTGYPDVYAQNWQVTGSEPMLFTAAREPQFPQKCLPALVSESRNLRGAISEEEAAEACSHIEGPKKQFCIYDLIATGDRDMVQDSFYTD